MQHRALGTCMNRLVLNTTTVTLIASDYKEIMKPEPMRALSLSKQHTANIKC